MSMISELVKELRRADNPVGGYYRTLYARAADTIEELSAKLATANMDRSTAHHNDGWIPCSKKNPSEPGYYEVTVNDGIGCRIRTMARYDITIKDWVTSTIHDDEVVVAWREPLPEPYKGVE